MKSLRLQLTVLVGLTLAAYVPALRGGFIWDDDDYVTENLTLRSAEGLRRIWFELGAVPQYYPLVHTTYWLEYRLWGLHPAGYHVVNVLLHAANAVLVVLVLRRLASARRVAGRGAVRPAPGARRERGVDHRAEERLVGVLLSRRRCWRT